MTIAAPKDMTKAAPSIHSVDRDWWRGAAIYQVYPRSYQDSNGDGIGDLQGITQRLPYIASLGVDAVWISPFFTSPMKDFGYDVSNYCDIDPMFGKLADFDAMLAEAHRLGLKIMIDLVLSHTSDQHPWFVESRSSKTNPKSDWYVWAEPKPDGTAPNNWLSIFGGPAWEWDSTRRQYFMHNFLTSQPDLNFHNMEVQQALLDVTKFWLTRGVDGFRLDTINFYVHDRELRDNPALPADQRNDSIAPSVNPYNYQEHLYDKNRPENLAFLERFRALLNQYPAATAVGEVGDAHLGLQIVADYTSGGNKVHMCYAFDFLSPSPVNPARVKQVVSDFSAAAVDGWACWAFSNHDVVRHASRLEAYGTGAGWPRMLIGLMGALRGSICIYQGEELGLREADVAFEDLQDPYGIRFWPKFKGRDGCRTPMVWDDAAPNAGFSTGKPWLPVSREQAALAVNVQEAVQGSMLNHYRAFLHFRRSHPALVKGEIAFVHADENVLAFTRTHGNEKMLCAFNFTNQAQSMRLINLQVLEDLADTGYNGAHSGGTVSLGAYDAYFGRVA
jgi:alpha-glucosidase